MTLKEQKEQLRKQIRQQKQTFLATHTQEEQKTLSRLLFSQIEQLQIFRAAQTILSYYSMEDEPYTHQIIDSWAKTKNILLPKVVGDDLTLHPYRGKQSLRAGAFNILEPITEEIKDYSSIDLVIVPGVAFDLEGNRLGRGRGYYDRLFGQKLPPKIARIGVCYPFQLVKKIPTIPTDIPMTHIISQPQSL